MKKIIFLTAMSFAGCAARDIRPPEPSSIHLRQGGAEIILRGRRCGILPSPLGGIPRCDSDPPRPAPPKPDPPAEEPQKEKRL